MLTDWISEAFETACGWAFCAVALYALLFLNLTGNGTLWDSLRGVVQDARQVSARNGAVQTRVVPVRPPELQEKMQNHMLMVPEGSGQSIAVPVVAAVQQRPSSQMTDAPADASAGKDWKVHLQSQLRTFTVYGQGDSSGPAAPSAKSAKGPASVASAPAPGPTPASISSAYHAGIAAVARPGIGDHVTRVGDGGSDGLRNFR